MEFNEVEILTVQTLLASVLEIGNVDFEPSREVAAGGGAEGAVLLSPQQLDHAARLLRVGSEELEKALCTKTIIVGGETIMKPLGVEAARALRDSLAKGLYSSVFGWMVDRANMLGLLGAGQSGHSYSTCNVSINSSYFSTSVTGATPAYSYFEEDRRLSAFFFFSLRSRAVLLMDCPTPPAVVGAPASPETM